MCKDLNGGNLSIKGKLVIDAHRNVYGLGNVTARNLRVNEDLTVMEILQKNTNGILINGDIIMGSGFTITAGDITADNITANLITGDLCGNLSTNNISAKTGTVINVANNLSVTGNVTATQNVVASKNVEGANVIASVALCGDVLTDNIDSKTGGNIAVSNNVVVTGFVGVSDAYRVNNVQVVGAQQMDIANISTANIFGTATDELQDVGNTATVGVDRSLQINNNFADLAIKMNAILDTLRTHGLIG